MVNCKEVFESLNKTLATTSIHTRPLPGEILYLYIVVTEEVVSTIFIRESRANQSPVYFISKALAGEEIQYHMI